MRAIRKHLMRERRLPGTAYDVMGYWRGVRRRQPRAVDPGPIWRAGKAAGKTDEQIWADYDAAREVTSHDRRRPRVTGAASRPSSAAPTPGKSTLTNALVGSKVVITSSKPQTTRTVVRGIVHRPDAQLILVDTPGLHRPRTLLGERLNDLVKTTLAEVDVVAVCFPANEKIGPGDRFIVNEMAKVKRTTKVAIATKTDLATGEQIGQHLLDIQAARAPRPAPSGPRSSRSPRRPATRSSCSRTCWSGCCPRGRSSTPTATSATPPRRRSSPS